MYLIEAECAKNSFQIDNSGKRFVGDFIGVRPFLENVIKIPQTMLPFRHASGAENVFYSSPNFMTAGDLYLNNAHKLIKFVQSELDLMHKEEIGIDHWYDVSGDFLDVGLLLDGEPEHFGNMYLGNPKRTFVTLILKLDISWSTGVEYLQFYAARILRLVEWLERKEVRTRIIAYSSTEIEHIEIMIKDFHEPLTLASVAITAHPDFYRRFVFRVRESSPFWNASYGSTEESDKAINNLLPTLTKESGSVILFLDRTLYENNREVTEQAFDSTEEYLQKMLLDEERTGSLIV